MSRFSPATRISTQTRINYKLITHQQEHQSYKLITSLSLTRCYHLLIDIFNIRIRLRVHRFETFCKRNYFCWHLRLQLWYSLTNVLQLTAIAMSQLTWFMKGIEDQGSCLHNESFPIIKHVQLMQVNSKLSSIQLKIQSATFLWAVEDDLVNKSLLVKLSFLLIKEKSLLVKLDLGV